MSNSGLLLRIVSCEEKGGYGRDLQVKSNNYRFEGYPTQSSFVRAGFSPAVHCSLYGVFPLNHSDNIGFLKDKRMRKGKEILSRY